MGGYAAPWTSISPETRIAIRIDITYPTALTLVFTDLPVFDAAFGVNVGSASTGMAVAFNFRSFKLDSSGGGDISIALRNVRYIADGNTTAAAYSNLAAICAHYMIHGAAVTIKQYCYGLNGTSDARVILDGAWTNADNEPCYGGAIANVTSITGDDITLQIAANLTMEKSTVPLYTVGTKDKPTVGDTCPELSKGLSVPMRVGQPVFLPYGWEAFYTTDNLWRSLFLVGSPGIGVLPARLYNQDTGLPASSNLELGWTQCECLPDLTNGTLRSFGPLQNQTGVGAFQMYEYLQPLQAFGRVVSTEMGEYTDEDVRATLNKFFNWRTKRRRKLTVYLIPKEVVYATAGVTNPEAATDRKPDTYTTIGGVTAEVRYRIPNVGNLGTIRPDSGLQVFVITRKDPPGNTGQGAGNFRLGIKEPIEKPAATWQFSPTYSTISGASTDGIQNHTVPTTGWIGTKWQQWDFTASGTSDTTDGDSRVWVGDIAYAGYPFDIAIQKTAGSATDRLYIVAVGLVFSFIKDVDDYVQYVLKDQSGGGPMHRRRMAYDYIKPWTGSITWSGAEDYNLVTGNRKPENNKPPVALPKYKEKEDAVDPEGAYGQMPGWYDDTDAYGGGVGWITKPGSICAFLADYYASPRTGYTIGITGTPFINRFGTVRTFNAMMDLWTLTAKGAAATFQIHNWWTTEQAPLEDHIDAILSECPGNPFRTLTTGHPTSSSSGIPGLACQYHQASVPNDQGGNSFESLLHGSAANGLLPERDICMALDRPAMEIMSTSARDVVNDIEVHYQYDPVTRKYGRIASCNARGSDDGYGGDWPRTPGGGPTSSNLCEISETCFGRSRKLVIKLQYIWDRWSALAYAISQLWLRWRPIYSVRFNGTLACQDMTPGHLISFSDTVTSAFGVRNPVPFRETPGIWAGYYWRVTGVERADQGQIYYPITAVEHYNSVPVYGIPAGVFGYSGGPAITPGEEGFDQ